MSIFWQGIGNEWGGFAANYYFVDTLHLSPARQAALSGFALLPWQIKAVYGMMNDMVPIYGYHKAPYVILAGFLGTVSALCLCFFRVEEISATLLIILSQFGIASPDVSIDAAVAERAKSHPHLAADMQALCWGSLGVGGFFAAMTVGKMQTELGSRGVFGFTAICGVVIAVPAMCGFLKERRDPPGERNKTCERIKAGFSGRISKWVFWSALVITACSLGLGLMEMLNMSARADLINGAVTLFVAICVVAPCIWFLLGRVSPVLAKAAAFIFLRSAIQPSSGVLFQWYKASESNCERGYPCLSPEFIGWMDAASYLFLVFGTVIYQKFFSSWSYRTIFAFSQVRTEAKIT